MNPPVHGDLAEPAFSKIYLWHSGCPLQSMKLLKTFGSSALFCCAIQMQAQVSVSVDAACPVGVDITANSYSLSSGLLSISKPFDACSPGLFNAVVTQRHLAGLTLTETDSTGQKFTLALTNVIVANYEIGAASSIGAPTESWSFRYESEIVTTGESSPVGAGASTTSVQISGLGCTFTASNWSFGASVPITVFAGSGGGASRTSLNNVSIMKPVDSCSLALSKAQSNKQIIPSVILTTQVTGSTGPLLKITLTGVEVVSNSTSTPKSGPATELITLSYRQVMIADVSKGEIQAGWNVVTNTPE
jgi:type VI protein secretion system component Hcp